MAEWRKGRIRILEFSEWAEFFCDGEDVFAALWDDRCVCIECGIATGYRCVTRHSRAAVVGVYFFAKHIALLSSYFFAPWCKNGKPF